MDDKSNFENHIDEYAIAINLSEEFIKESKIYSITKRTIDIIGSLCGIILLSPLFLIVSILIKLDSKGPVIFKQTRIGKDSKPFEIYKFRSMKVETPNIATNEFTNASDYITKIGKFIRKTSLDEVPQLFNILKGDMSFIGPRPPLTYHPWEYSEYTDIQKRMFDVRPGITGWAQINGRKGVEWNKRIELNVWYVDNVSFLLDTKIFFKTIKKTVTNADNENTGATVEKKENNK